jgi:hypothetical protein
VRAVTADARVELLVLRHENTLLRCQISRARYQPADRLWLAVLSRVLPGGVVRDCCTGVTAAAWFRLVCISPDNAETLSRRCRVVGESLAHEDALLKDIPGA